MTVNYEELANEWLSGYFFDGPDFFDIAEYVDYELEDNELVNKKKLYEEINSQIDVIQQRWADSEN